jgi:hypothetical protein
MARLALVREQISSIEKTRVERLERAPDEFVEQLEREEDINWKRSRSARR